MTNKPIAVVVGFTIKLPVAGMALYNFHYIKGLRELGYEVHYVERINMPDECYDPARDAVGDDPSYGLAWLQETSKRIPGLITTWTLIDQSNNYFGTDKRELCSILDKADFVLTLADPTWFDELERCPRRAFIDGDPLFTQVEMLDPTSPTSIALVHYPVLFTYWSRQGASDTTVPTAGRDWISTRPVVATSLWNPGPPRPNAAITNVMNWKAWSEVEVDGQLYGHKDREFQRISDLPRRTQRKINLAVGGPAPKDELRSQGWNLIDPIDTTRTIESYQRFIDESYADLGIAKHAYVASRTGWFSDRSLCYLASGKPVIHQDTGFTDWLDAGEGVFAFSGVDDIVAAIEELDRDYGRHVVAARLIAEQSFEARMVIGDMLDNCGYR
jgi:hypothetical protein